MTKKSPNINTNSGYEESLDKTRLGLLRWGRPEYEGIEGQPGQGHIGVGDEQCVGKGA